MKSSSVEPSFVRPGIVILTVVTALVHLSLNVLMGQFDVMFTLNGLGYLALLAALFLNLPLVNERRQVVRLVMIAFAVITIVSWILMGDKSWWLGWLTKADEVVLIGLLLMKRP